MEIDGCPLSITSYDIVQNNKVKLLSSPLPFYIFYSPCSCLGIHRQHLPDGRATHGPMQTVERIGLRWRFRAPLPSNKHFSQCLHILIQEHKLFFPAVLLEDEVLASKQGANKVRVRVLLPSVVLLSPRGISQFYSRTTSNLSY